MRQLALILLSALVLSATSASAALISYTGSGSVTRASLYFPSGDPNPTPTLSISFSFVFDDAVVPATGSAIYELIPLDAFTLTPGVLGDTAFDASNTVARLDFFNGTANQLFIGGIEAGAGGMTISDDFVFVYNVNGLLINANWRYDDPNRVTSGVPDEWEGSFSTSVVPEPGTALLIGLGLAGLAARRL